VVLSGDCITVRQPRVEARSSGEGGAHYVEFYQRAAHLLYHRFLERKGGLVLWLTQSAFLVAPQERVDTLLITLVDQS